MNVIKVEHIPVVDVDEKRTMFVRDSKKMKFIFLKIMINIEDFI